MAYNPKSWGTDELLTAAKMNQCKESLDWLHARLPFVVGAGCVPKTTLAAYIINANIFPGNASGNGDDGLVWEKLAGGQGSSFLIVRFIIPDSVFSNTPRIVGASVGAGDYPWLVPTARLGESATGFIQRFGMTDHPPTNFGGGHFNFTALLIGTRKTEPT